MIDFKEAFRKEQEEPESISEKNHQEIDSVFQELKKQLAEETKGKVQLKILKCDGHHAICANDQELAAILTAM